MLFASLVFISAFLIETIGSYISIIGLSALFSTNPVIIALALSLDIAKIVTVSFLYKQWENINRMMRVYMIVAAGILMIITSSGAAGYLSAEFQKAIIPTKESDIVVKTMTDEKVKLEARKLEIDKQIAQLPPENVRGRTKLAKQFSGEITRINDRLVEIDKALPEIQIKQVDVNAHAGPILYIAQAFDTTVESAVKYVILLIIFVFDPLAVALIIAGNFLLEQLKRERDTINKKLDDIKREVDHIEEEIGDMTVAQEAPVMTTEDFITLHPDDKRNKGTLIETLPDFPEPEQPVEEAPAFITAAPEFDPADWVEVTEEEEAPAPVGLVEISVESEAPVQTDFTTSKKKRGRKKKEESEPKPAITTEEQLSDVVDGEILLTDEPIEEIKPSEPEITEVVPKIVLSDLGAVNQENADVTFLDPNDLEGSWKPSKKVMNVYTK